MHVQVRKRYLPDTAINTFADEMELGEAHRNNNIEDDVVEWQEKSIKESRGVPISFKDKFAQSTIDNCTYIVANHGTVCLCLRPQLLNPRIVAL